MRNPFAWLRLMAIPLLVAAVLIPVTPASATARGPDLSVRSGRSAWVGQEVVDASGGPHQRLAAPIQPRRTRDVVIELRNLGPQATFMLTAAPAAGGFTVSYTDGRHQDVTSQWTGAGEAVRLGAGLRVLFHLQVTAPDGADTGTSLPLWIRAQGVRSGITDLVHVVITVGPLSVVAISHDGQLKCSASFPLRSVQVGSFTQVTARVTNVTHHAVTTDVDWAFLRFRDVDGSLLFRTGLIGFFSGPPPPIRTLAPGHSLMLYLWDTKVRWPGPVDVQVICGGAHARMHSVRLDVTSPGAPASVAAAIDEAVGVRGSPFQDCHPGPNGEPATGAISTPDGRDVPPLTVRCWATVTVGVELDIVRLHLVSPDDAPSYTLSDRFRITPQPARDAPNFVAATWAFVVTSASAHPYVALEQSKAVGTGPGVYGYYLRHGRWQASDRSICGSESYWLALTGNIFPLDFITGCTAPSGSSGRSTGRPQRGAQIRCRSISARSSRDNGLLLGTSGWSCSRVT